MAEPPLIVLGGSHTAVAVTRSVGRTGAPVYVLSNGRSNPARFSRFCTEFVDLGVGDGLLDRWVEWLERGPRRGVLAPCSDDGVELVGRHRELRELGYTPIESDHDVLLAMLDKDETYRRARELGVPTPWTRTLRTPADLDAGLADLTYPAGLKPLVSHVFANRMQTAQKIIPVDGPDSLRRAASPLLEQGLAMLLTEIIPGGEERLHGCITYIGSDGRPAFVQTQRKLRQYPPRFGVGVFVTNDWDEETAELGVRFAHGVGHRGPAHVEFKRDPRDGKLKLLELNPRFHLGIALVCATGVDWPLLAYNRALGRPDPPVRAMTGRSYLWVVDEDLRALAEYRRAGQLTYRRWLRSLMRRLHFAVFAPDDPMPTLAPLARKLAGAARGALLDRDRR
jgi:D-aspartate ligase